MKSIKEIYLFTIEIDNITYLLIFQWRNITQVFLFAEVLVSVRLTMMSAVTSGCVVLISEVTNVGNCDDG